jgi:hypothetical protein
MSLADRDSLVRADDAEVIERSRREPEYFAVLFDRHAPRIHRYVARPRAVKTNLTAEQLLDRAATAALRQTVLAPRPDQFVYTVTEDATGRKWQTWLSADGSKNGLERRYGGAGGIVLPKCRQRRCPCGIALLASACGGGHLTAPRRLDSRG